jgi:hypothetical protein
MPWFSKTKRENTMLKIEFETDNDAFVVDSVGSICHILGKIEHTIRNTKGSCDDDIYDFNGNVVGYWYYKEEVE